MNLEKDYESNPYNDADYVRFLVETKKMAEKADENGQTLLHKTQNPECFQILVDAGADVNAKDMYGDTPLHLLARYPNRRKDGVLSEEIYFNVSKSDKFFNIWAKCAEILINAGSDVNAKNNDKEFPLFGCFNPLIVGLLLKKGANPLSKLARDDIYGQITARDFIEFRCWTEREKFMDDNVLEQQVMRVSSIEKSLKKAEKEWMLGLVLEEAKKNDAGLRTVSNKNVGNVQDSAKVRE